LKQNFCGRMPFLSPTSRNHSLDLIFSLTTKTPEQETGVTTFTSALQRQYLKFQEWPCDKNPNFANPKWQIDAILKIIVSYILAT